MAYINLARWTWTDALTPPDPGLVSSDTGYVPSSAELRLNIVSLDASPGAVAEWLSVMVAGDSVQLDPDGSSSSWTWILTGPPTRTGSLWLLPLAPATGSGAVLPGQVCAVTFLSEAAPGPPPLPPLGGNPLTEARLAVIAALEAAIPELTTYPAPPEVISTPCAIVSAKDPWLGQRTFSNVEVLLSVNVGVTVTGLNREAYANLEQAVWNARTALDAIGITGPIAPPAVQKFGQADVALCSFNVRLIVSG